MYPMMTVWFDKIKMFVGWEPSDQARMDQLRCCLDSDLSEVPCSVGRLGAS
jgi:hypothetical protein